MFKIKDLMRFLVFQFQGLYLPFPPTPNHLNNSKPKHKNAYLTAGRSPRCFMHPRLRRSPIYSPQANPGRQSIVITCNHLYFIAQIYRFPISINNNQK